MNETALFKIERANPNLLLMPSAYKKFTFATAIDDDRMMLMIDQHGKPPLKLIMTVEEAYAVSQEIKHMLSMVGRGRAQNTVGRKHR